MTTKLGYFDFTITTANVDRFEE